MPKTKEKNEKRRPNLAKVMAYMSRVCDWPQLHCPHCCLYHQQAATYMYKEWMLAKQRFVVMTVLFLILTQHKQDARAVWYNMEM